MVSRDWLDILTSGIVANESWGLWQDTKPLSFFDFVYQDLDAPPFSALQKHISEIVVGQGGLKGDPEVFYDKNTRPLETVLLLGKGSGKGFLASYLQLFNIYMLHWLPIPPAEYFGLSKSDDLAIVTVATNTEQAGKTFKRIINRLVVSKFFNQFPIEQSGKLLNRVTANPKLPKIKISMSINGSGVAYFSALQLYLNVVPSKNESFEGNTLIGWVMDEASGFVNKNGTENANRIYNTLSTSVRELPYLGIITSFPRRDRFHDFTYLRFLSVVGSDDEYNPIKEEFYNKETRTYAIRAKTWEVKPSKFYSGETFKFVLEDLGIDEEIPIEYRKKFMDYPYDSVSKYMCIPVGNTQKRFAGILLYMTAASFIDKNMQPMFHIPQRVVYAQDKGIYLIQYDYEKLEFNRRPIVGVEYFMGIDAGESDCRAVISIGRTELRDKKPMLIVEDILMYKPDSKQKLYVDLLNFFATIIAIARALNIQKIKSDRWNTTSFKYTVKEWDDRPVNRDDYTVMINMLSNGMVLLPEKAESYEFIEQIKSLYEDKPTSKPRSTGYQDIADAVAGLVFWARNMFHLDPNSLEKANQDILAQLESQKQKTLAVGVIGSDPHEHRIQNGLKQLIQPQPYPMSVGLTDNQLTPKTPAVSPSSMLLNKPPFDLDK